MKKPKCLICGKAYYEGSTNYSPDSLRPRIDKVDCYLIYKKLLSIYGNSYIRFLNDI